MVNKDFCLSSYIAFRYIWKDGVDFAEGFQHKNFRPVEDKDRVPVKTPEDIDREIKKQFDELYAKYNSIGILLSGGMDSANLAAYLKPGSHAYTFNSVSGVFDADMERVRNGEPKYLVRGLYAIKYPELEIPFKIPMPRPVDSVFKDWAGPKRGGYLEKIFLCRN